MVNLHEDRLIELLAAKQSNYCSVFSNARRIRILWALADQELSVGAIAEAVGSSLQNISQHLSMMKAFSIVSSRREGQMIYYRIEEKALVGHCLGLLRVVDSELATTIQQKLKV